MTVCANFYGICANSWFRIRGSHLIEICRMLDITGKISFFEYSFCWKLRLNAADYLQFRVWTMVSDKWWWRLSTISTISKMLNHPSTQAQEKWLVYPAFWNFCGISENFRILFKSQKAGYTNDSGKKITTAKQYQTDGLRQWYFHLFVGGWIFDWSISCGTTRTLQKWKIRNCYKNRSSRKRGTPQKFVKKKDVNSNKTVNKSVERRA